MRRLRPCKPRLALLCLTGALTSGLLAEPVAPAKLRVLFPADRSVLDCGTFQIVCAADDLQEPPALTVDGKSVSWEPYRLPALTARVDLAPGRHELQVGAEALQVFVKRDDDEDTAPAGWQSFWTHRPANGQWKDCSTCHEVTEEAGRKVLGKQKRPHPCLKCHAPVDFEAIHFHPLAPLAPCELCHNVHGSSNKALLKGPVKPLCAKCHE